MFRQHCQRLVDEIVGQVENYRQCGYRILGFFMIDGSPVCGLNRTPRPKNRNELWGGMVWYVPESENMTERGVFCEILQDELKKRGQDDIPFVAAPESEEIGSIDKALKQMKALLL